MNDRELMIALVLAAIAGGFPDPVDYAAGQFSKLRKAGLTNNDGTGG